MYQRVASGPNWVMVANGSMALPLPTLARYGIALPRSKAVASAAEAAAAAEAVGFPVALKLRSPDVLHKTEAGGVALAAFAGVLAAPIYSVNPNMGSNFIITVFAVVVIGGMGSILGSIVTGFGLGIVEGLTEFLPVSSTGHLLLMEHFFGFDDDAFGKSFAVLIQLGAILAIGSAMALALMLSGSPIG